MIGYLAIIGTAFIVLAVFSSLGYWDGSNYPTITKLEVILFVIGLIFSSLSILLDMLK